MDKAVILVSKKEEALRFSVENRELHMVAARKLYSFSFVYESSHMVKEAGTFPTF